jgi:hypothetical protein
MLYSYGYLYCTYTVEWSGVKARFPRDLALVLFSNPPVTCSRETDAAEDEVDDA